MTAADEKDLYHQIHTLATAALHGTISDDQRQELETLVASDEQAGRIYTEYMIESVILQAFEGLSDNGQESSGQHGSADVSGESEREELAPQPSPPARTYDQRLARRIDWRRHPVFFVLTVAVIWIGFWVFIGSVFFPWGNRNHIADSDDSLPPKLAVAQLTSIADAVWAHESDVKHSGSFIEPGQRLELFDGLAEITFDDGAQVILQGATSFEVQSTNGGRLRVGRLTARVPQQAVGFTVDAPLVTVTDLGTEFAVDATAPKSTDVHVFDGIVELVKTAAAGQEPQKRRLTAGESVRISEDGLESTPDPDTNRFVRSMPQLHPWKVIGLYTFEGNAQDVSGRRQHGAMAPSVTFAPGFEGQAVHFTGVRDCFIDLPIDASAEKIGTLTWGAWVRPAQLGPKLRCILSTDEGVDFDRQLTIDTREGEASTGTWRFAVFTGQGVLPSSGPLPEINQWTFVAAVYNEPAQMVALYVEDKRLNGGSGGLVRSLARQTQISQSKDFVRVGMHAHDLDESFAGEIDNVFLVQGALTSSQLETIRTKGAAGVSGNPRLPATSK